MFRLVAFASIAWLCLFRSAVAEENSSAYFGPHALFQNGKPNLFYKEGFTPSGAQKGFTVDWLKDRSPTATANRIVGSTTPLSFGPIKFTVTGATPVAGSTFLTGAGDSFYVGGDKVRALILPPMLDSDLVPRFLTVPIDYCPDYNNNHYIWMTTMLSKGQKALGVNAYTSESAFFGEGILNATGGVLSATVTHRFGLTTLNPPTHLRVLGGFPSVGFTCSLGQYVASGGGSLGGSLLHNEGNAELSLPGGGNYTTSENGAIGQQLVSYDQAKILATSPDGRIARTTVNGAFSGNFTVTDYTITAGVNSRDNLSFGQASYAGGKILYTPYSDPSKGTLDLTKQIEIEIGLIDSPRDGMFGVWANGASNGVATGAPTPGAGIYNGVEFWTKDFVVVIADPYNFPYARFLHFSTAGTADLRVTAVDGVPVTEAGTVSFGDLSLVGPQTKSFTVTNVGVRPAARIGLGDTGIGGANPEAFEFTGGFPGGAGPAFCAPGMILLSGESCRIDITSRLLPSGVFVAAGLANIEYFDGEQTWRTTQGVASTKSITSLACNAPVVNCASGDKLQVTATATVSGTPYNVTDVAPWFSTVPSVATISSVSQTVDKGGVVTCLQPGTTQVRASLAGQSCSSISIHVDPPPGIFVTGPSPVAKDRCAPYLVSIKTPSNAPYLVAEDKVLQILGSAANKAYLDAGCTVPASTVTIPAGFSTRNLYFKSIAVGTFTLIVDDNGLWGNATPGGVNQKTIAVNAVPPPTSTCGEQELCDEGDLDSICYIRSRKCVTEIVGTGSLVLETLGSLEPTDHSLFIQMGNVTLNAGTEITLDGFGDGPGLGLGKGQSGFAGGGAGHGGAGQIGYSTNPSVQAAGGTKYDDEREPELLGSGGGSTLGGAGGGALHMIVGVLKNDGTISANGANGKNTIQIGVIDDVSTAGGGGAGGSIWLDVDKLEGTGTIAANGGLGKSQGPSAGHTGNSVTSGRGGGGRIAVYYFVNQLLASKISTSGFEEGTRHLEQKIGPPTKLAILGPNDVNRDSCVSYTVRANDAYGSAAPVIVDTFTTVTVNGAAKLWSTAGCSGAGTTSLNLILDAGTNSLTYWMKDTTVQTVTMSATSPTLAAASNLSIGVRVFAPTLVSISPVTGFANAAFPVTLTGTAFRAGATASIGSTPCASTVVSSPTTAVCNVPSLAIGTYAVTMTNPDLQAAVLPNALALVSRAIVTNVAPAKVGIGGGYTVTLTGAGFESGMSITIGGVACATSTWVSATSMICAGTPALAAGDKTIVVSDSGGNGTTLENGIEYRPSPTLSSISPTHGPIAGGGTVSIVGTNLFDGGAVKFGTTACTGLAVQDSLHATCVIPASAAGTFAVSWTNQPENLTAAQTINYTFDAPPTISSLSPSSILANTSKVVQIGGGIFVDGATATVNGTSCNPLVFVSASRLDCTAPALAAGAQPVVVTNPDGQSGSSTLTYNPPPTLSTVSPNGGSTLGNANVTLVGTGFRFGAVAKFGTDACSTTEFTSASELQCKGTPAHALAGTVDVTVENPDGGSVTKSAAYTYRTPPTITSFSPTHGLTSGGTTVTIYGTGFDAGVGASMKGTNCASLTRIDDTTLTCVTAAGTAGAGNVVVSNSDSQTASKSGWTYDAPPTVVSVSPSTGPLAGGTAITITGTDFFDGPTFAISIGGVACGATTFVSATSATCVTPVSATSGTKLVRVTNPDGQYHELAAFTYRGAAVVTSVSPATGVNAGGASVTINGSGFTPAAGETLRVLFGSKDCTSPVATSNSTITCVTPANPAGAVRVTVRFVNSQVPDGYLDGAYTYTGGLSILSLVPASGSVSGGTTVKITGSGFISGAVAKIATTNCTSTTFVSATELTCVTPAGSAGAQNVTVTNPDTTAVTLAGAFTYGTGVTALCSSGDLSVGNTCTVGTNVVLTADSVISGGGDLNFTSTSKITCSGSSKITLRIDVRNFTMASGSQLDLGGCGYRSTGLTTTGGGPGGGLAGTNNVNGGSHGGVTIGQATSKAYDTIDAPTDAGSAGGPVTSTVSGGAGGGAILIRASGTATLGGQIWVYGATGFANATRQGGGGSGGTINIDADTIAGGGLLNAAGGDGYYYSANAFAAFGGGGGRIALKYNSGAFSGTTAIQGGWMSNGSYFSGAGTYYTLNRTTGVSTLKVDNGTAANQTSPSGHTPWDPSVLPITNLTLGNFITLNIPTVGTTLMGNSITQGTYSNVLATTADLVFNAGVTWDHGTGTVSARSITAPNITLGGSGPTNISNNVTTTVGSLVLNPSVVMTTVFVNPKTDLTVNSSAWLTLTGTATITGNNVTVFGTITGLLSFDVASLNVTTTGVLDSNGLGGNGGASLASFSGQGLGASQSVCGGGAYGGNSFNTTVYGSATNPTDVGSGGSFCSSQVGGKGGGKIRIKASGTVTNNGDIRANGLANVTSGSGGSIWITAATLAGTTSTATIRVNSNTAGTVGTGGGGGRLAIDYATYTYTGLVQAYGGGASNNSYYGGAGTIYLNNTTSGVKELRYTNPSSGVTGTLLTSYLDPSTVYTLLTVGTYVDLRTAPGATLIIPTSFTVGSGSYIRPLTAGTALTFAGSGNTTITGGNGGLLPTIVLISGGGGLALSSTVLGSATAPVSVTAPGGFSLTGSNAYVSAFPGTMISLTVNSSCWLYTDATITTSGAFTIAGNLVGNVTANVGGNATVSGTMQANALGASGGTDASQAGFGSGGGGYLQNFGGSGGGYGGKGGIGTSNTTDKRGNAYGSFSQPTSLGSGGGTGRVGVSVGGGNGGGAIKLVVAGTLSLGGTISADGGNGGTNGTYGAGGGSGGSVWIEALTLSGAGTARADGGIGGSATYIGGSGGGGRVAYYYTTSSFSGTFNARGGISNGSERGGAGTVYSYNRTTSTGTLLISNNGSDSSASPPTPFNPTEVAGTILNLQTYGFAELPPNSTWVTPASLALGTNTKIAPSSGTLTLAPTAGLSITGTGTVLATAVQGTSFALGSGCTLGSSTAPTSITTTAGGFQNNGVAYVSAMTLSGDLTSVASSTLYWRGSAQTTFTNVIVNGAIIGNLDWIISGNLTVATTGAVQANGLGFAGGVSSGSGSGPGAGVGSTLTAAAGAAGHGGKGGYGLGQGAAQYGAAYGSLLEPTTPGSGGGASGSGTGGAGGGTILLDVKGTATVSGIVSADGAAGVLSASSSGGGGAGGSVNLRANVFTGTSAGVVRANGGNPGTGGTWSGGGGGGGRVAVRAASTTYAGSYAAVPGSRQGTGGVRGGAGTIVVINTTTSNVAISFDSSTVAAEASAPTPFDPSAQTFSSVTLGSWVTLEVPSCPFTVGGSLVMGTGSRVQAASGSSCGLSVTGDLTTGTNGVVTGDVAATGNVTFGSGTVVGTVGSPVSVTATTGNITFNNASAYVSGMTVGQDLLVNGGSSVNHSGSSLTVPRDLIFAGSSSLVGNLNIVVNRDLTIPSGSSLNANGLGGAGGAMQLPGAGTGGGGGGSSGTAGGAGGSYGAYGGAGLLSNAVASPYGESAATTPVALGSGGGGGGGSGDLGGAGGGAIKVTVNGTLTNHGTIGASGVNGSSSGGGGSGGSVWVITNALAGTSTGIFAAIGGSSSVRGGGGAGGRIAIYYNTSTYTGTYRPWSGTSSGGGNRGGAGMTYLEDAQSPYAPQRYSVRIENDTTVTTMPAVTLWHTVPTVDALVIGGSTNLQTPANFTLNFASPGVTFGAYVWIAPASGTLDVNVTGTATSNAGGILAFTSLTATGDVNLGNGQTSHQFGTPTARTAVTTGGNFTSSGTVYLSSLTLTNATKDVTVNLGVLNYDGTLTAPRDLFVNASARIFGNIDFQVARNFTIASGGFVDANGLGFAGGAVATQGEGPGGGTASTSAAIGGAGGSHGGYGGRGLSGAATGAPYGGIDVVATKGSGGGGGFGAGAVGGAGGGLIKITALNLSNAGTIRADGVAGTLVTAGSGGGSGGGIDITAPTFTGSGAITADGGAGTGGNGGGGGGGGRVSVKSVTLSSYSGTIYARGGNRSSGMEMGGSGFVYRNSVGVRTIRFDNNANVAANTVGVTYWDPAEVAYDSFSLNLGVNLKVPAGTLSLNGTTLSSAGQSKISSDAGAVTLSFPGAVTISSGVLEANVVAAGNLTITSSTLGSVNAPVSLSSGGAISLGSSYTGYLSNLTAATNVDFNTGTANLTGTAYTIPGNLTVTGSVNASAAFTVGGGLNISGTFSANGMGGPGGNTVAGTGSGPGGVGGGLAGSTTSGGNGGSHAAYGGKGASNLLSYGEPYDSIEAPVLPGSGGGGSSVTVGGKGGGALSFDVTGNASVTGSIFADGLPGSASGVFGGGGGAGGSIYLKAAALSGNGDITANGGAGGGTSTYGGGGGSGGRIALITGTSTFSGNANAYSGARQVASAGSGGVGTVFTKLLSTGDSTLKFANVLTHLPVGTPFDNATTTVRNLTLTSYVRVELLPGTHISIPGNFSMSANTSVLAAQSGTYNVVAGGSVVWAGQAANTGLALIQGGGAVTVSGVVGAPGAMVAINSTGGSVTNSSTSYLSGISAAYDIASSGTMVLSDGALLSAGRDINVTAGSISGNGDFWAGNLTLSSGATITASGFGDVSVDKSKGGGAGGGNGGNTTGGAGGGAYGAAGGNGATYTGGAAHGTDELLSYSSMSTIPVGSAGGSLNGILGGTAGGRLRFHVRNASNTGKLTNSGTITANGNNGGTNGTNSSAGGAAGGSILVDADQLLGSTGVFRANGGVAQTAGSFGGGGGAGGRIQYFANTNSFSGTTSVTGGSAITGGTAGGTGTISQLTSYTNPSNAFPSQIAVLTPPTAAAGACVGFFVELRDVNGNAANSTQYRSMDITAPGVTFYNSNACTGTSLTSIALTTGTSRRLVYAKLPASATTASIALAASGLTTGNASIDVGAGTVLPYLSQVPDYAHYQNALLAGTSILAIDFNNEAGGYPGNDTGMTYACTFDTVDDGAVASGADCLTLPGAVAFNTSTGVFSWATGTGGTGTFELRVVGTNANGTSTRIFLVNVRPNYSTTALRGDFDGLFSRGTMPTAAASANTTWIDLSSLFLDATLKGTAAWAGTGATGGGNAPYRVALDGSGWMDLGKNSLAGQARWHLNFWLRPTSVSDSGVAILTNNGNGANGPGISVRQSRVEVGKLQAIAGQAYADVVLDDLPAAYWPLSEASGTAMTDISGGGRHGTITGGSRNLNYSVTADQSSRAVTFSGGSSSTTGGLVTNAYSLLSGDDTHSIELLVRPTASQGPILDTPSVNGVQFSPSGSNTVIWKVGTNARTYNSTPLMYGSWLHIVMVKKGAGDNGDLYINGALQTPTSGSLGSMAVGTGDILVGRFRGTTTAFSGEIANVAIYQSPLSAAQVLNHYNASIGALGTLIQMDASPLTNNIWSFASVWFTGSTLQGSVNGGSVSSLAAASSIALAPSTAPLVIGSATTDAAAETWKGSIGEVRVYGQPDLTAIPVSSGTASTSEYLATADRYRTYPIGGVAETGLFWHFDISNSNYGFGVNTCGTSLLDLSPRLQSSVPTSFACNGTTSGLAGSGLSTDPWRYQFPGSTTSYLTAGSLLWPSATYPSTDFTVEFWVKPGATQNATSTIFSNYQSGINGISVEMSGTTNSYGLWYGNGSSAVTTSSGNRYTPLSTSNWNHFVIVKSGTTITNYLNGAVNTSWVASSAAIGNSGTPPAIGNNGGVGSRMFTGGIAKAAMYHRALSAAEVSGNCKALVYRFSGTTCN